MDFSIWGNPSGYGPRQPNLIGNAGAPPGPSNNWGLTPIPTHPTGSGYDPRSPYNTGGGVAPTAKQIGTTKTTTTKTTAKPAALSPMDRLLQSLYGQIETPAQQEARVNREVNAQIAAQQKMVDQEYARQRQDALAQYQAQAMAGSAAAAMSGDLFNQVGGEYNQAANEIKGLSHGLTGAAGATTQQDVKGSNKALAASGNLPVQTGGVFGVGGGLQQGVEDYRAGTLGGQLFTGLGNAANFGLAGLASSDNLRATQEANAALMTSMHDIRDGQDKAVQALAAGRADLAHTYMNDAKDAQIKSISLIQGLVAQKQASAVAGAKSSMDLAKFKLSVASLNARIQNQNAQQSMAQIREGRMNKVAGFNMGLQTKKLENEVIKNAQSQGQIDVNRSKALKYIVDKAGNPVLDSNGQRIPSTRLFKPTAVKPPLTPGQLNKVVSDWYAGKSGTMRVPALDKNNQPIRNKAGVLQFITVPAVRGKMDYQKGLARLKALGYSDVAARTALNSAFRRTERQRPALAVDERAVLTAAKVKPTASVMNKTMYNRIMARNHQINPHQITTSYLNPDQAKALDAAGKLPPGRWVSGYYGGNQRPNDPQIYIIDYGLA